MEQRNSPGRVRLLNENSKSPSRVLPVSPLNLHFDVAATCTNSSSNGIIGCPSSPRSILTNKLPPHNFLQANFNQINFNNNQQQHLFQPTSISPIKSPIQVRSKPELPSYFTFPRHPNPLKARCESGQYESGAISDEGKGEFEKIESILGELDFSKYKRRSGSNRQSNFNLLDQQLSSSPQEQHCNYSLVPIRVQRSLSHQTSASNHQEKLRELRELTEKLKPTLNQAKLLDYNISSSSANSPYFSPKISRNCSSRRTHFPILRSASVPHVDGYDDLEEQVNNRESQNNVNYLHKSFASSENISERVSPSTSSTFKLLPKFQSNYERNRLNAYATLPRTFRGGSHKMENQADKIANFNQNNWKSQEDDAVRQMSNDCSADEDSEATTNYAPDNYQTSATAIRHRVTPTSDRTSERFDLQVEAAIAELQAVTSISGPLTDINTPQCNSLDRRKQTKRPNFNMTVNDVADNFGNTRSLSYPPQRRTSLTEGMEYAPSDINGVSSYFSANSMLNSSYNADLSGHLKSGSGATSYSLQVAEDDIDFSSLTPEADEFGLNKNLDGKIFKKKHYSEPSGDKNNEGLSLDLPEFVSYAISEPQLPNDSSGSVNSKQSNNNSLIPHAGLTRSTSLSPNATENLELSSRNGGNSAAGSEMTPQQRRYSKKRLRGPYGEMLEEEMRKSGEKQSQKVIPKELSFLQELVETRPASYVETMSSSSSIEPRHSRYHPSSQSLDENALRSNSAVLDIYNPRSGGGEGGASEDANECFTSFVPTLRLKDEGPWNLCESLDGDEDIECLLRKHQDTRTHVVAELYDTEKSYVESLQILVNKYFRPLKSPEYSGLVDAHLVEEMFFQIPEILNHHEIFLEVLKQRLENWDNKQKVGDVFVESFTRQPIIDTYTAFINNWKSAKEAIKIASQAKPAFAKFLEHMSREHKGKLTLDALLIMPVQRIPRYELLIKELLKHTQLDHPDHRLLITAQKEVHNLAVKINHMEREAYEAEQMQLKLREMESLIDGLMDLVHPMRTFLRYDLVTMSGSLGAKKERCLFLFSDLLVIASIKKKSGPMRKTTTLGSPGSLSNLLEMNKYKLLMKISLDDLDIARSNDTNIKKILKDIEQLESDVSLLNQINDLSGGITSPHQNLDDVVKEMLVSITKLLQERQTSDSQLLCLELTVTTQVGVETMSIIFGAPDKRAFWEAAFHEAKQKLALSTDRRPPPEFLYPLPIRKTRAGLQFTCASPTLGLNAHNMRDVWVCNSDGYVGQVCVLSLQPDPTVTSCNGVCNSRILCIASIPAAAPAGENLTSRRRSAFLENRSGISISIEDVDEDESCPGNGNIQLDSDSSEEEKEPLSESQDEDCDRRKRGESPNCEESRADDVDNQSPTMWLGTEDGCVHVYNCSDNIRIKKNKIKLQHPAVIHCIIHMDNKVFVSLANGDVAVYHRDPAGGWNTYEPTTISIGTAAAPVTRMLPVLSKLWCGCHNMVKILCTATLEIEHSFPAHADNNRPIQCMVSSGLGVWTSVQNSSIIKLFHATSYETLLEVNVAPAVSKMLAVNFGKYSSAGCDDIIRQHKTACLRVTSLLACKDLLWIGTSAGVVLNLILPHLSTTTTKLASIPNVSGIPHGHTGHVRFLTCVEMTSMQDGLRRGKYSHRSTIKYRDGHGIGRRASTSALGSNRLLVISGGDGYEDFRNTNFSEAAGRDDSTNHLLLWQV